MINSCIKCNKNDVQKDTKTGILVCKNCGYVYDDSQIVETIEFGKEQNPIGTFINTNQSSYINSMYINPIDFRLNKVFNQMNKVSKILSIPDNVREYGKKIYKLAMSKNLTKGRKTNQIVGGALYLACRAEGTHHLLIDFSEALQINMFLIGTTYLKLAKIIDRDIKIIDPSLYMHRFCNKLFFGNNNKINNNIDDNLNKVKLEKKSKEIENTALKILQFLKRDWIVTGRRPTGLCGACLLISAKLHGYKVSIDDVANIVHVCNETIKKRIDEFSMTKLANMSKEEFESFENTHFYPGREPPAFLKNRETEKNEKDSKENKNKNHNNNNVKNNNNKKIQLEENEIINEENYKVYDGKTEKLSVISDKEINKYIFTDNEYHIRKHIWNIMYKDWIEEQKEKEEKEKNNENKIKRIRYKKINSIVNKTPEEAIKNCKKFSAKINNNYIREQFRKKNY